MAYNTLVSVSERVFPGISVVGGQNYNTMEYAAVKLGNQVVSSLALQLGRSLSHKQIRGKPVFEFLSLENKISNESTEVKDDILQRLTRPFL